ncbi:MAG: hypothetical protein CMF74_14375 [Maricaulis sp.]|jgi:hypothetical protein|nr:hypothetical protein [Maricaulis sp.]|tara:strand:+ start:920 stop:1297 length:378 start_codon:yes stop_codon:yes gene_type:complete
MAYARGKYAQAISDRSGLAFPYNEMVKEWNGSFVHKSEFEAKHPQIRKKHIKGDAIALANARPRPPENEKEFLLFISSGFFADNGDGGIGGTSMTVAQSDSILGTKLTAVSATSAVGTDFTVVIS